MKPPRIEDLMSLGPEYRRKISIGIEKGKRVRAAFRAQGLGYPLDSKGEPIESLLELSYSEASHPMDHMDEDQQEIQRQLLQAAARGN
ncbi:MAG: hypothetical protein ACK56I_23010, partial [bacterium]